MKNEWLIAGAFIAYLLYRREKARRTAEAWKVLTDKFKDVFGPDYAK